MQACRDGAVVDAPVALAISQITAEQYFSR